MGVFDKLMFWKKEDAFESELKPLSAPEYNPDPMMSDYGQSAGLPPMQSASPDFPRPMAPSQMPSQFPQPDYQPPSQTMQYREIPPVQPQQQGGQQDIRKEIELVSSKLDTLRAMLDNINTRLGHIENLEEKKYKW